MFEEIKSGLSRSLDYLATKVSQVKTLFVQPSVARARVVSFSKRMYAMARPGRTTSGWGMQTTSEDTELSTSLRPARNRSRELVRDAAYAKRAKVIVQNNVIGPGIGLQAKVETTRGTLNDRINDEIEERWKEWCHAEYCHMGKSLHFMDMQRLAMGQIFETGEIFMRFHFTRLEGSPVPLAIEMIEPERMADEFQPGPVEQPATVRMGVEVDQYYAPIAYWIRNLHPGDLRFPSTATDRVERVPARDIIHARIIERWPQTRGIPWMHAAGRKLNDMDGLTEAEITAARASSCYMGFIEPPPDNESSFEGDQQEEDGSVQEELEPAVIHKLNPGEKFNGYAPTRPNTQIDPFMRMMLREVAAGTGPSYESLSRDYSQSNYSSSRLALLDDRDLWRVLQLWFIRTVMQRVYTVWLQQAVLSGAIASIPVESYALRPRKFETVLWKPRGWSWVDPTKEVEAYKEAIRAGFTTVSAVISQTADGRDLEDVLKERQRELAMMKQMGLTFDTDPSVLLAKTAVPPKPEKTDDEEDGEEKDPAVKAAEKVLQTAGRTYAGSR